jgi:hypothetical protein
VLTRAQHWSLSWARLIHSILSQPTFLSVILILFSRQHLWKGNSIDLPITLCHNLKDSNLHSHYGLTWNVSLFIVTLSDDIFNLLWLIINNTSNNSIQFNSCLFTCRLNSPEASYKVSTGKKKQQQNTYKQNTKQGSLCNSVIAIPWKK